MGIYFLCITVLALASGASMSTCPSAEDIHPCTCNSHSTDHLSVTCSHNSLSDKSELKKALSSLSGKQKVSMWLSDFELGRVPSDLFSDIGIWSLWISSCNLDTLSDGGPALQGLENTLEELIISESFTEHKIPTKLQIGHFKKLKRVHLRSNRITELGDDWFQGGPISLESLVLSDSRIQTIGSNAFADLVNLGYLKLDGNRLRNIQRSMFPSPAKQLKFLDFGRNDLTVLPADIFTEMPELIELHFMNNRINYLDERVWSPVWKQLDTLGLQNNPIRCDDYLMQWLFKLERPRSIYGTCAFPKGRKGYYIDDLIDSKRQ